MLTHLDGKKIRIRNTPGQVIKPDEIKVVEGHGMPFHKRTFQSGNLFILFKIKFPTTLDAPSMTLLSQALGTGVAPLQKQNSKGSGKKGGAKEETKMTTDGEEADETVEMKTFEEHHKNVHHGGGARGGDSDEEEEDGHGHHG